MTIKEAIETLTAGEWRDALRTSYWSIHPSRSKLNEAIKIAVAALYEKHEKENNEKLP